MLAARRVTRSRQSFSLRHRVYLQGAGGRHWPSRIGEGMAAEAVHANASLQAEFVDREWVNTGQPFKLTPQKGQENTACRVLKRHFLREDGSQIADLHETVRRLQARIGSPLPYTCEVFTKGAPKVIMQEVTTCTSLSVVPLLSSICFMPAAQDKYIVTNVRATKTDGSVDRSSQRACSVAIFVCAWVTLPRAVQAACIIEPATSSSSGSLCDASSHCLPPPDRGRRATSRLDPEGGGGPPLRSRGFGCTTHIHPCAHRAWRSRVATVRNVTFGDIKLREHAVS